MHRGFNLTLNDVDLSGYQAIGKELHAADANAVKVALDHFLGLDGVIDGSSLQELWFPQVRSDVFISHSHANEEMALGLAGCLKQEFGLKPFIDSCVWGYVNDLQRQIDRKYCLNPDKANYDYDKRNGTTSHVHMMLSTALTTMIDNTECLIFLNTPTSITTRDSVSTTQSPWLYMELGIARMIRQKTPDSHRELINLSESRGWKTASAQYKAKYKVDLTPLTPISKDTLERWASELDLGERYPLDCLYRITPPTSQGEQA
ncbi:MAG: hypothetical protein WCO77_01455 [bacterium]